MITKQPNVHNAVPLCGQKMTTLMKSGYSSVQNLPVFTASILIILNEMEIRKYVTSVIRYSPLRRVTLVCCAPHVNVRYGNSKINHQIDIVVSTIHDGQEIYSISESFPIVRNSAKNRGLEPENAHNAPKSSRKILAIHSSL